MDLNECEFLVTVPVEFSQYSSYSLRLFFDIIFNKYDVSPNIMTSHLNINYRVQTFSRGGQKLVHISGNKDTINVVSVFNRGAWRYVWD